MELYKTLSGGVEEGDIGSSFFGEVLILPTAVSKGILGELLSRGGDDDFLPPGRGATLLLPAFGGRRGSRPTVEKGLSKGRATGWEDSSRRHI